MHKGAFSELPICCWHAEARLARILVPEMAAAGAGQGPRQWPAVGSILQAAPSDAELQGTAAQVQELLMGGHRLEALK